ncbi:MAG: DNA repair protein RecO [Clostridia bacterium]|nr:DNA repair protein RecO [Clostridia bacterium]
MIVETEGMVLKQVKAVNGRRMLVIFTKKYGKLSVGTGLSEKGKSKTALAIKPFTIGNYELFKSRDFYNINNASTKKTYYSLGEDIDKYMAASYIMEWTDKALAEDMALPLLYKQLLEFMDAIVERKGEYMTLVLAYQIKALKIMGIMPYLDSCVNCGEKVDGKNFVISEGGAICKDCAHELEEMEQGNLIFKGDFNIGEAIGFLEKKSFYALQNISLKKEHMEVLQSFIKKYSKYYLDIDNLKSESFIKGGNQNGNYFRND